MRQSSPYDGYRALSFTWPERAEPGEDVAARLRAAAADLNVSVALARSIRDALAKAAITKSLLGATPGQATVETPHGPATISLVVSPTGTVTSLVIDTTAFATVHALDTALAGSLASQAPLVMASLDICPECVDL